MADKSKWPYPREVFVKLCTWHEKRPPESIFRRLVKCAKKSVYFIADPRKTCVPAPACFVLPSGNTTLASVSWGKVTRISIFLPDTFTDTLISPPLAVTSLAEAFFSPPICGATRKVLNPGEVGSIPHTFWLSIVNGPPLHAWFIVPPPKPSAPMPQPSKRVV